MRGVLLLLLTSGVAHASGVDLKRVELRLDGRVSHVTHRDLDGDGIAELLAMARQGSDDKPTRTLAIWPVTRTGINPEPSQLIPLPEDAVVVDACDVLPAAGTELLLLTGDGLSVLTRGANGTYGAPAPLVAVPGVLGFPDEDDAPFFQMCRRPAGAATAVELWVPTGRGVAVLAPDKDGVLQQAVTVAMRPRAYHQSGDEFRGPRARRDFAVLTMLVMPRLLSMDADHDGDDDLYQVVEDTVALYLRDGGKLSATPVMRRAFNVRTPTDRARRNAVMDVMLGDLTGDGLPDAVVTKLTGGMTSLKTESRLYVGQGPRGFAPDAVGTRKHDGYATPLGLFDVDGDGRMEVLEPVIRTSPLSVAGMLVKQRVDVELRVLRSDGTSLKEGGSMAVPFALDTAGAGVRGGLPLLGQDVDGDGRSDMVNLGSGDKVEVLRGVARDPPFEEDPAWAGKAPSTVRGEWYVPWPKGPASVVLFYPDVKAAWGKVTLFFNARVASGPPPP